MMSYKKDTKKYPTTVVNFYDRLQKAKYSHDKKIEYIVSMKKKTFNISRNKIANMYGVPYGNNNE